MRAYMKEWAQRPKNRPKVIALHAAYYVKNKARMLAQQRAHREANIDLHRARDRKRWHTSEKRRTDHKTVIAIRYAQQKGAVSRGDDYTYPQFKARCDKYGGRCWYCGKVETPLHADHFIPLKLNGRNNIKNIVPACRACNSRKNARPPEEFLARTDIDFSLVDEIVLALMKIQAAKKRAA
jgi:5-methylcytosine-specific restriction endonuclease McrA